MRQHITNPATALEAVVGLFSSSPILIKVTLNCCDSLILSRLMPNVSNKIICFRKLSDLCNSMI